MTLRGGIAEAPPARFPSLAWLKPAVFTGALIPLIVLLYRCAQKDFADPIAEVLNKVGLLALVFLLASLACTPLKLITGWSWPLRIRRMLGVFSFFYALLHFTIYLGLDQGLFVGQSIASVWSAVIEDITERNFILVGFVAFLILIPLALTSTGGMVRRLGAKRWQALHKLAYLAGILGVAHFIMRVKADLREPLIYAGILVALLLVRSVYARRSATISNPQGVA